MALTRRASGGGGAGAASSVRCQVGVPSGVAWPGRMGHGSGGGPGSWEGQGLGRRTRRAAVGPFSAAEPLDRGRGCGRRAWLTTTGEVSGDQGSTGEVVQAELVEGCGVIGSPVAAGGVGAAVVPAEREARQWKRCLSGAGGSPFLGGAGSPPVIRSRSDLCAHHRGSLDRRHPGALHHPAARATGASTEKPARRTTSTAQDRRATTVADRVRTLTLVADLEDQTSPATQRIARSNRCPVFGTGHGRG